jgi:uncharacterized protein YegL
MRRLPVYLLIDCSESMAGEAIQAVESGLNSLISFLRSDPYALESVALSVITFGNTAKQLVPLTDLTRFNMPDLVMGSGTALGAALKLFEKCMATEVMASTAERKGDFKPMCFIMTDGNPTDSWEAAANQIKSKISGRKAHVIAVGCGPDASARTLSQITDEVLLAKDMNPETLKQLFKWVSASVATASQSIETTGDARINLEKLPTEYIEKASKTDMTKEPTEDQFVFLHSKCIESKGFYIMRFGRYEKKKGLFGLGKGTSYMGVASHAVDNFDFSSTESELKISVEQLELPPECPYCNNSLWGMCSCGRIHCVPGDFEGTIELTCSWCNNTDTYGMSSFDVGRGRG